MLPSASLASRGIRKFFGRSLDCLLFLDYSLSGVARKRMLDSSRVDIQPSHKIVIYSVFLKSQEQFELLHIQIESELKDFDLIIIVNTGELQTPILKNPRLIYIDRPNRGRDLASLSYAIKICHESIKNASELLVLNDSVYWAPRALSAFVAAARKTRFDVTALTSSEQHRFHLQSYAFHFKFLSDSIILGLRSIGTYRYKRTIVHYGEKKLSRDFLRAGVKLGALFDSSEMKSHIFLYSDWYGPDIDAVAHLVDKNVALNPTIHFWPELALSAGVVKKSLLKNPAKFRVSPSDNSRLNGLLGSWGFKDLVKQL